MNAMLDARIVAARIHGSVPLAQGGPCGAAAMIALSHGDEAMEATLCQRPALMETGHDHPSRAVPEEVTRQYRVRRDGTLADRNARNRLERPMNRAIPWRAATYAALLPESLRDHRRGARGTA
jgi:hypothetical protein